LCNYTYLGLAHDYAAKGQKRKALDNLKMLKIENRLRLAGNQFKIFSLVGQYTE